MNIASPPPQIRPATVGLLWHSLNSDNLGVTALTISNIALIEAAARKVGVPVQFVILGWRDTGHQQLTAPNIRVCALRARHLVNPRGLYAEARKCDLILDISAGDSFADIYGARRFIFNSTSKTAVRLARRPLILPPQTIGPFTRPWAVRLARRFMNGATAVFTRDRLSTDYAHSIGVKRVTEACDVAFVLPYSESKLPNSQKTRVGINISGLLFNGGYTGDNMFSLASSYPDLARRIVSRFLDQDAVEVHLVSHVISDAIEVEDDYRVAQQLAGEFPGAVLAPRFATPSEAKSYISGLDFFTGSRMHACIAAFSSGVPVVPMAYSRKFAGLFGTLGYDLIADCKTMNAGQVTDMVMQGFAEREALKPKIEAGRKLAQEKLKAYSAVIEAQLLAIGGASA